MLAVAQRHRLSGPRDRNVAELAHLVIDASPPLGCGEEYVVETKSPRRANLNDRNLSDWKLLGSHALIALTQPGVGNGDDVLRELAATRLGRTFSEAAGQRFEAGQAAQPFNNVGLGGEELLAAQAKAVDQAVDETVGPQFIERAGGLALKLEEGNDSLTRFGRDLRRLGSCIERANHVEFASARDLHAAGEVDGAQFDRCSCQRANGCAGVAGAG